MVRSDSAGDTQTFTAGLARRNTQFEVVARSQTAVSAAITTANEDPRRWQTAVDHDGSGVKPTDRGLTTSVCDVTDLVDLAGWPEGTRLIIRRQPLHPGARPAKPSIRASLPRSRKPPSVSGCG
jgi:hypothetical protein